MHLIGALHGDYALHGGTEAKPEHPNNKPEHPNNKLTVKVISSSAQVLQTPLDNSSAHPCIS